RIALLFRQRQLQGRLREEALVDEHLTERTPAVTLRARLGAIWSRLRLGHGDSAELDAVLPRERPGQLRARDAVASNQDLAQQAPGSLLLLERALEVGLGEQPVVDEQHSERPPGEPLATHSPRIGAGAVFAERLAQLCRSPGYPAASAFCLIES